MFEVWLLRLSVSVQASKAASFSAIIHKSAAAKRDGVSETHRTSVMIWNHDRLAPASKELTATPSHGYLLGHNITMRARAKGSLAYYCVPVRVIESTGEQLRCKFNWIRHQMPIIFHTCWAIWDMKYVAVILPNIMEVWQCHTHTHWFKNSFDWHCKPQLGSSKEWG